MNSSLYLVAVIERADWGGPGEGPKPPRVLVPPVAMMGDPEELRTRTLIDLRQNPELTESQAYLDEGRVEVVLLGPFRSRHDDISDMCSRCEQCKGPPPLPMGVCTFGRSD